MKKFAIIVAIIAIVVSVFTFTGIGNKFVMPMANKIMNKIDPVAQASEGETVLELDEYGYDIVITKTDHDKYPYIVEMTTKVEGEGTNVVTGGPVNYGYMRIEMSIDEETYQDMTSPRMYY